MPYILLTIIVLIGLVGLYTFLVNASPKQALTLVVTVLTGVLALTLFFLAVTGRLPAAIAIVAALWPVAIAYLRKRKTKTAAPENKPLSRAEALDILGLTDPVTEDDIQAAYKRLMMKVHPDQQGSEWMAAKLNAARDFLLRGL